MFASTLPAKEIFVTSDPTIAAHAFLGVTDVVVPQSPNVCGNDIALLILASSIKLPQYVTPTLNPPMTDRKYTNSFTAIGYGVDTPEDGGTAGVRRIKQNINLVCVPNDSAPNLNCLNNQQWLQIATAAEFAGGDGTCEGDSGSGAYEQSNFDTGKWVAFGVLSRGSTADDGGTCLGSIYSRFDAWSQLIIDTANKAAQQGGYPAPSWTTGTSSVQSAQPTACQTNGVSCGADTDCCSVNCVSHDNTTYACVACDCANPCNTGYACNNGICVAGAGATGTDTCATSGPVAHAGGCSLAPTRSPEGLAAGFASVFAATAGAVARRKRRKAQGPG